MKYNIGNLVKSGKGIYKVVLVSIDGVEVLSPIDSELMIPVQSTIFEPIEIAEEWLLKFGFELYENRTHKIYALSIGDKFLQYIIRNDDKENPVLQYYSIPFYIKYVHQLQNLYFALTGEELQVK